MYPPSGGSVNGNPQPSHATTTPRTSHGITCSVSVWPVRSATSASTSMRHASQTSMVARLGTMRNAVATLVRLAVADRAHHIVLDVLLDRLDRRVDRLSHLLVDRLLVVLPVRLTLDALVDRLVEVFPNLLDGVAHLGVSGTRVDRQAVGLLGHQAGQLAHLERQIGQERNGRQLLGQRGHLGGDAERRLGATVEAGADRPPHFLGQKPQITSGHVGLPISPALLQPVCCTTLVSRAAVPCQQGWPERSWQASPPGAPS